MKSKKDKYVSYRVNNIADLWATPFEEKRKARRFSEKELIAAVDAFYADTGLKASASAYFSRFSLYLRDLDCIEDQIKFLEALKTKVYSLGYSSCYLEFSVQSDELDDEEVLSITLHAYRDETPEETARREKIEAAEQAKREAYQREADLAKLAELKAKYEGGETQ